MYTQWLRIITVQDYTSYFSVVQSTGQIQLISSLNMLLANLTYRILINATHGPYKPNTTASCVCHNSSNVFVDILVTDLSQKVPKFSSDSFSTCTRFILPITFFFFLTFFFFWPIVFDLQFWQAIKTVIIFKQLEV